MQREILFRGKRLDNGRWVEGFYSNLYIEEKGKEYVWCSYLGICLDRCECNKPYCNVYEKPKKGNICANRGRAFAHGEKVRFDVKTGKKIKQQNERA